MRCGKLFEKALLLVIMSMIISLMSGISFPVSSNEPAVNVALGKDVTVSTVDTSDGMDRSGGMAVDGNPGTRWSSEYYSPQWIYVDLGSSMEINRVVLNWEAAYARSYIIQISDDAEQWTDIYTDTNGNGGVDDIIFDAVTAKYVRMYGVSRGSAYGYSLWEFEIYSGAQVTPTPTPTPTPTAPASDNLALNKAVAVSSVDIHTAGGTCVGELAVDGKPNTRWSSQYSSPQWIYVDLGGPHNVNRVVLNWEDSYAKSYIIQTSDDAEQWTDVYTDTNGNGGIDDISFDAVTARYVRMYGVSRISQYGYSLWEFEVYGATNDITLNFSGTTATALASYDLGPAVMIVAAYDTTKKLVNVEIYDVNVQKGIPVSEDVGAGFLTGSSVIKVMLWDGLNTIRPFADVFVL